MKQFTLSPAQEAVYSQLFGNNPLRKIRFDQAYEDMVERQAVLAQGALEHEDILDALRHVEACVEAGEQPKKVKKRAFMVACELMLSRDMGLYDPVAFIFSEDEQFYSSFIKIPIDTGDTQFEWLAKLQELDELFTSLNTMSQQDLKQFRLAIFTKPYEDQTQKSFNWIDVARKCERPLLYDFQMDHPSECYICVIGKVRKE